MSNKFKQERQANVTKPGEKPLDPDVFEANGDVDLEQSQGTTGKTEGAHLNERDPALTKPGEQPMDPDKFDAKPSELSMAGGNLNLEQDQGRTEHNAQKVTNETQQSSGGKKGSDRIEGTSSYNSVKSGKIRSSSDSTYLSQLTIVRTQATRRSLT
jgi:hypothetical protein